MRLYKLTTLVALLVAACTLGATMALAHVVGSSWNITTGNYTVDIGYDTLTFTQGQPSIFNFLLWNGATSSGELADYAQIWVRFVDTDSNTELATGLFKQPLGGTTLLYVFPEAGDYKLEASYRDANGNEIAAASIPFTVTPGAGGPLSPVSYIIGIAAFLIGAAAAFVVLRARKSS